ncbi:putative protein dimerization activity [Lyophyllum shimeji]|uniref:HAT C-terminal dimerisation domain-containing protein n=1 Tax=Lyophyllum shimeji TaxID=47721 RepID=A0A9P3PYC1_LYOSH|nr:putative protein dimerization activity [Lyophyllum shimeji]
MAKAKDAKSSARSTKSTKSTTSSIKSLASKAKTITARVGHAAAKLLSPSKKRKRQGTEAATHVDQESISEASSNDDPAPAKRHQAQVEVINLDESGEEVAEDSEAELDRMKKKWDSPVYAFFGPVPEIVYVNGRRCHEFACAAKGCKFKARRYLDTRDRTSTSNLIKHVRGCWGEDAWAAAKACGSIDDARKSIVKPLNMDGSILASFERKGKGKVTYSHRPHTKAETRAEIVRWVTESVRPYKIVDDPRFHSLMKTGRPEYWIPSASTVSRDVKLVFGRCRERIAKILQEHDGKISFATDAWTSPNHYAYVAVTAHLEVQGSPISLVLDVVEVPKSHTGLNLALAFAEILKDFGIENKILGVTCDNASNNDTMTDAMEDPELLLAFQAINRARCFLHIINLVAKSLLKPFDPTDKDEKDGELSDEELALRELEAGLDEEEEAMKDAEGDDESEDPDDEDLEEWVDEIDALTTEERKTLHLAVLPVRRVLAKLRKLAFKIINSTTILLPAWKAQLAKLKLAIRIMPRDVRTRWNSTYDMLSFALSYKEGLVALTGDVTNGLRAFELSAAEWEIVGQLQLTLKALKDATLYFSRGTPNLPYVIPVMDRIDTLFTTALKPTENGPAMRAAIEMAKRTLNRYYSLTDGSEVYRIAMVLHPRHKLEYFERAGWKQDWIKTAHTLVRDVYNRSYANRDISKAKTGRDDESSSDADVEIVAQPTKQPKVAPKNMFDDLFELKPSAANPVIDELNLYLSTPAENVGDAIQWWYEKRLVYPRLSRMALDYLSIPATSVDVERVFSRGRLILSHTRSRLSALSTRALLCLGSWSLMGLVRDEDVTAVGALDEVDGQIELDKLAQRLKAKRS